MNGGVPTLCRQSLDQATPGLHPTSSSSGRALMLGFGSSHRSERGCLPLGEAGEVTVCGGLVVAWLLAVAVSLQRSGITGGLAHE
jgi:hypothetical protein